MCRSCCRSSNYTSWCGKVVQMNLCTFYSLHRFPRQSIHVRFGSWCFRKYSCNRQVRSAVLERFSRKLGQTMESSQGVCSYLMLCNAHHISWFVRILLFRFAHGLLFEMRPVGLLNAFTNMPMHVGQGSHHKSAEGLIGKSQTKQLCRS